MAKSRELKEKMLAQYENWLGSSQAMIVAEYKGMAVKDLDALRAKVREVGGEFHIVKNTLGRTAFAKSGFSIPQEMLEGSTGIVFAFQDPPATAKALVEFARTTEAFKIKGGMLGKNAMTASGVKALADMPPLPVMRAQLLGTIMAPASQLARILAEPSRQVAAVVKAYSERDSASAAA